MSVLIGTSSVAIPGIDGPTILVNEGTDDIYVGTVRGSESSIGVTLQPLASYNVDGSRSYYARAASGTQELGLLAGGSGFTASPQQLISVLNTSQLADAVALSSFAKGARLVDSPGVGADTLTPGTGTTYDCSTAQGLELAWTWNTGGAVPGAAAADLPYPASLRLTWMDDVNNPIYSESVELAVPNPLVGGQSVYGVIRCPAVASQVRFTFEQIDASLPLPVNASATLWHVFSNRPTDRFRYWGANTQSAGDNGQLLIVLNKVLPVSTGNSYVGLCLPFDGPVDFDVFTSQSITLRFTEGGRYRGSTSVFRRSEPCAAGTQTHFSSVLSPRTQIMLSADTTASAPTVSVMANRVGV